MRWMTALILAALAIGCSGPGDVTNPVGPAPLASMGPNAPAQLAGAPGAEGREVIRVPEDYATIQAAVDAAGPGAKIQVGRGVYCENVVITKANLRLQAPPGAGVVVTGDCPAVNRLQAGIQVKDTQGVEISGFIVEYFEWGIQLLNSSDSRVHLNEARYNRTVPRTGVGAASRGMGIQVRASSLNVVSQNYLYENGRNGINVVGVSAAAPSNGNVIRANRLKDNNLENAASNGMCNLMVNGYARENLVAENEVLGTYGVGIMVGPGAAPGAVTANRFAQNRIHGFGGPGITAQGSYSTGNVIEQNDARGNGLNYAAPQNVDLWDFLRPTLNIWNNNLGTCASGVC